MVLYIPVGYMSWTRLSGDEFLVFCEIHTKLITKLMLDTGDRDSFDALLYGLNQRSTYLGFGRGHGL